MIDDRAPDLLGVNLRRFPPARVRFLIHTFVVGFPPEIWYDIADEEGFLIQDEFPIWLLGEAPEKPSADNILPQYSEWMRERWNHPCVVIWGAQNESFTAETGKALQAVRRQDIPIRPWDNGWGEPQSSEDCIEAHPYLFIRAWQDKEPFRLKELAGVPGVPSLQEPQKRLQVPIIINGVVMMFMRAGRCLGLLHHPHCRQRSDAPCAFQQCAAR